MTKPSTREVPEASVAEGSPPARPPGRRPARRTLWLAAVLTCGIGLWALAPLLTQQAQFAVFAPGPQAGLEAAAALARLFAALVLVLFLERDSGGRMMWIAGGLVVMSLGGLGFGYLELALLGHVSNLNTTTYEYLFVLTVASTLFVAGLVPGRPPPWPGWRLAGAALVVLLLGGYLIHLEVFSLPNLVPEAGAVVERGEPLPEPTGLYRVFSIVPLGLAVAATLGAAYHYRLGELEGWLLISMVLLAGAQLHNTLWPSTYSSVIATADLLRFGFAVVVAVGGVLGLRRIARERERLLATEQERNRRLAELSALRADFTAMVAHELSGPVSGIRAYTDVLRTGALGPDAHARALDAVEAETEVLNSLLEDVQASAAVERDDFAVRIKPVPLKNLMETAARFAGVLPGDHPVVVKSLSGGMVMADEERIGQVLRNLVSNAAKYSPDGARIELRAVPVMVPGSAGAAGRVRVEVADRGIGIHPEDMSRIFEKFGRGRDREGRKTAGVGLGLYLSRRIARAHGTELTVRSAPGAGSVFAFELEVTRESGR